MENNFQVFNQDVDKNGSYIYTKNHYSAQIATKKQVEEIISRINKFLPRNKLTVLDIGCGDGTYTLDIASQLNLKLLIGIDPAKNAITIANKKIPKKLQKKIRFMAGNIYQSSKLFKPNSFDIIILQGILHHLDSPQKAISQISNLGKFIILLEPNGYNPILKVIEKLSPYHIIHKEKSYWPPALYKWFIKENFKLVDNASIGLVPYFCPNWLAKILKKIEPIAEKIPLLSKIVCGQIIVLFSKTNS